MEHDRQSDTSNGRRESSTSGTGGEGSDSSTFGRARAQPQGRVPEYVDMVIPDYASAANENAANGSRKGRALTVTSLLSGNNNIESSQENINEEEKESLSDESREASSREKSEHAPTDSDVLLNEGNEEHPGNVTFAGITRNLAKKYTKVKAGYRSAAVQILVTAVKAQGGRFLETHQEGQWREVSNRKAYAKSSRAIRSTCRNVEANSSRNRCSRRASRKRQDRSQGGGSSEEGSMEVHSASDEEANDTNKSHTDLQMITHRLQTKDKSLAYLNLDLVAVNHDCIFPFAKSLESSDLLQSLDIRFSHLNRTNANALAWGIKHCKALKQVRFSYSKWEEKVSIILASVLENPSVESLNLDKNDIGTDLIKIIYRMISNSENCQLRRLSLEGNPITNEGATVLAKLITNSKSLKYLSIGGNNLEANGMEIIRNAISNKKTCMFEVSGLESVGCRKRPAVPQPSEDSEEHTAKKPRGESSSTSSADGARTSSDTNNPSSSHGGTDDGPASSMNDSGSGSDGPASSSTSS